MRNLFSELFPFRARENFSAKENFLTEGFAYFLQRNKKVCEAFVKSVLGYDVEIKPDYLVTTRVVEATANGNCFPDLRLIFRTSSDILYAFLSEHKWDSDIRPDQLVCYAAVLNSIEADKKCLITIVAQPRQKKDAEGTKVNVPAVHLLWEDVYEVLKAADSQDLLLAEFVEFMKAKNLNAGPPIESSTMRAFLESVGFKQQLIRCSNKLLIEYDWSAIPKTFFTRAVGDRWGRVALDFRGEDRFPTLAVGFLFDTPDHRVTLTAPRESIDLFLRIEADPNINRNSESVLSVLREKAKQLRLLGPRVLLRDDDGNGNEYSLLMAQEGLNSLISELYEERAQIEAIYHKLYSWVSCLFEDKSLEDMLTSLRSSGLAIDPSEITPAPELQG